MLITFYSIASVPMACCAELEIRFVQGRWPPALTSPHWQSQAPCRMPGSQIAVQVKTNWGRYLNSQQASMGGTTTTLILNRALLHGRMGFAVNHNRSLHTPTTPHTTKRRIHTSHPHEAQRHADVLMVCVRFETTETEAELRAASPSARSLWRTPGISIRTTEISRSRVH